jgi:hypothetical protein
LHSKAGGFLQVPPNTQQTNSWKPAWVNLMLLFPLSNSKICEAEKFNSLSQAIKLFFVVMGVDKKRAVFELWLF